MAHREFVDARAIRWQVWSVHPASAERRERSDRREESRSARARRVRQELRIRMEAGLAHGWLVFESAHEKRRLRPIPDGWESESDATLQALLDQASPAPHTTRRLIE